MTVGVRTYEATSRMAMTSFIRMPLASNHSQPLERSVLTDITFAKPYRLCANIKTAAFSGTRLQETEVVAKKIRAVKSTEAKLRQESMAPGRAGRAAVASLSALSPSQKKRRKQKARRKGGVPEADADGGGRNGLFEGDGTGRKLLSGSEFRPLDPYVLSRNFFPCCEACAKNRELDNISFQTPQTCHAFDIALRFDTVVLCNVPMYRALHPRLQGYEANNALSCWSSFQCVSHFLLLDFMPMLLPPSPGKS